MKNVLAFFVAVFVAVGFFSAVFVAPANAAVKNPKVGFIFYGNEDSTYDANFINAAKRVCRNKGVEYILKMNVPESEECTQAAAELVHEGCTIIFADSFGHEPYLLEAAKRFPQAEFAHATGLKAHTAALPNFHNAFAAVYEGRYLTGIAAGLKLNEMIAEGKIAKHDAKLGYVGAYTYPEVMSGYTAFFLGARSVCKTATMDVFFTGSWYDYDAEKAAAEELIKEGAVLISQHADSLGSPSVCEANNVPNVAYNISTLKECPNTFLISSKINWAPYFAYLIECAKNNRFIAVDWTGHIEDGSVELTAPNGRTAAKGTLKAIGAAKDALAAGSLHVFDTRKFTVEGVPFNHYKATIDADNMREVIYDDYFHESEYRSAPYFDLRIDGIRLLNTAYK